MRISGREERVSKMINSGMSVARIERAKKEKKKIDKQLYRHLFREAFPCALST